ncbi:MAG: leucine--tRNA ligase [Candidatus Magasanikbacteria bacterium]|nr:leucine--tRNA ligase [Candidatus Magasanikbacteria bacterium]
MSNYNHKEVEKKWKEKWEKEKLYQIKEDSKKKKFFVLDMFPYPSGVGLHVGHPKGYIATDVIARMKMMQGYNVLHPMGWDAFGLPAENYAIANKVHPSIATAKNIETFKKQLGLLGFTYDWEREINTTDPNYYKWTQWAFIQMFKRGLAFESYEPINWCPTCKTGLANEDLENGKCERCNTTVERKPMRQWVLKITDYAERLLADLDKLEQWPESIKDMQRNWIGKSEGALIKFNVKNSEEILEVFTTRPDTLFGATYCVIAPEHSLIKNLRLQILNYSDVEKYVEKAKNKSDLERIENKEKTGVELKGVKAINPVNNEEIPIFVADYVLTNYGTGAIMAVPAHDQRDFEFAKKFNLPIKYVIMPEDNFIDLQEPYIGDGIVVKSDFIEGLNVFEAKEKIIAWLEEKRIGQRKVQYKLRDWVFSRQRYWGEPIPLIHCEKCGWQSVPEKDLPLELPKVENYEPSGTGESPLVNIAEWVNTQCPVCGGLARRETNTMPQWAGSCWYYLRYCDPKNKEELINKEKEKYWNPVDLYVGGAEHATRHLIYARFWHKFLFDIGIVSHEEPFIRLQNVGLILAEDGRKMSKRWNNVINPDDIVEQYGADAMRLYEMFMGPFDQPVAWSTQGVIGMRRFLEKVWALKSKVHKVEKFIKSDIDILLHQTIKKVSEDIEAMRFNTAISQLMILVNEMSKEKQLFFTHYSLFLQLLAPFAPHITEELWVELENKESIFQSAWPKYDPALIQNETTTIAVQVNGKLRDTFDIPADMSEEEIKKLALSSEKVQKWLENKEPKKIIYVKGKLVSVVV